MDIKENAGAIQEEYRQLNATWRRRLILAYYIVIAFVFIGEVVVSLLMDHYQINGLVVDLEYWMWYAILPSGTCLLLNVFSHAMIRSACSEGLKDHLLIFTLLWICFVVATVHGYFLLTTCVFSLPITISLIFNDRHFTNMAYIHSLIGLFASVFTSQLYDQTWSMRLKITNSVVAAIIITINWLACYALLRFEKSKEDIFYKSLRVNESMSVELKKDAMTQLYNHTEFYNCLEEIMKKNREEHTTMVLSVMDVDHFKKINDGYGHSVGDQALIKVSQVIRKYCSEDLIFRYGGDEFAVIFYEKSMEEAMKTMDKIRLNLSMSGFHFSSDESLSISFGLFEYSGQEMNVLDVFEKADQALYCAKRKGRNQGCSC